MASTTATTTTAVRALGGNSPPPNEGPTANAPPREYVHRQYLLALAKANVLPRLLDDEVRMKEMGIRREEYGRLMRREENHGMKGFELVKGLLYQLDYEAEEMAEMVRKSVGGVEVRGRRGERYAQWGGGGREKKAVVGSNGSNGTNGTNGMNGSSDGMSGSPAAARPQQRVAPVPPVSSPVPPVSSPPRQKAEPGPPRPSPRPASPPSSSSPTPTAPTASDPIKALLHQLEATHHIRLPENTKPNTVRESDVTAVATKHRQLGRCAPFVVTPQEPVPPPSALASHPTSTYLPQEHRLVCPQCGGGSQSEKSLSVTVSSDDTASSPSLPTAKWNCFRASCGFSGGTSPRSSSSNAAALTSLSSRKKKQVNQPVVRPQVELKPLTDEMIEFFASRGISQETLERNKVSAIDVYDPKLKAESTVIGFPYYSHDLLVNVKYRTLDKRFWQSKGAEKMLYGLNDVLGESEIIIVEGEIDKLALEEAGITNVVSVPDGAPARVKEGDLPGPEEDTKYSYLWNSRAWLDQAVRIVIATDNDGPGDALAEELARRLGRERCWRVRWPMTKKDHDFVGSMNGEDATRESTADEDEGADAADGTTDSKYYRKDANDVLMKDGPEMLQNFMESAEPLPIRGLLQFHEYYEDIIKYYYLELKDGQGVKTGWSSLDKYYRVVPGELTIVTGVPNSGKSEWIDALLCNLSEQQGWQFAMCSMEKRATDHARQLAEKFVGKPFFDLPYSKGTPRMSFEELDGALDWVDDRFHLIRYEDDELPSVDWVLEVARAAVYRHGIRGLVIDPYNELDHQRPSSMSETEYVSKMLTKVKRFAQTAGVHVWFVAHPRQLHQWKGEAPNLYDISGSAHFINKADNGIVVHRVRDPDSDAPDSVEILVRKVRNKAAGTLGKAELSYDRRNGRYVDQDDPSPPRTSQYVGGTSGGTSGGSGMGSGLGSQNGGYYVSIDEAGMVGGSSGGLVD